MALRDILTAVRFYTQADVYYYTFDNRPLSDLNDRDNTLADELDKRTLPVDITGGVSPTTNKIPTGWTVSRTGAGLYTITHTLGISTFIATPSIVGSTVGFVNVVSFDASTINIKTFDSTGTPADYRFTCLVTCY